MFNAALFASSAGSSAAITFWLQSRGWGRWCLGAARWLLVLASLAYVVLFFLLYKPLSWFPVAFEMLRDTLTMNSAYLAVLTGLLVGTAIVQLFHRGGKRK